MAPRAPKSRPTLKPPLDSGPSRGVARVGRHKEISNSTISTSTTEPLRGIIKRGRGQRGRGTGRSRDQTGLYQALNGSDMTDETFSASLRPTVRKRSSPEKLAKQREARQRKRLDEHARALELYQQVSKLGMFRRGCIPFNKDNQTIEETPGISNYDSDSSENEEDLDDDEFFNNGSIFNNVNPEVHEKERTNFSSLMSHYDAPLIDPIQAAVPCSKAMPAVNLNDLVTAEIQRITERLNDDHIRRMENGDYSFDDNEDEDNLSGFHDVEAKTDLVVGTSDKDEHLFNFQGTVEAPETKEKQVIEVPHPFLLALSLFWTKTNATKEDYEENFFDVLAQAPFEKGVIETIPKTLYTLHKWRKQLPPSKICATDINVDTSGLPSHKPSGENAIDRLYYNDVVELHKMLLLNPILRDLSYFGMMLIVDQCKDVWEALVWGESLLTTSGEFAYYPGSNIPIFPAELLIYRFVLSDGTVEERMGLVRLVGKDYRSTAFVKGEKVVCIQRVLGLLALQEAIIDESKRANIENDIRRVLSEFIPHETATDTELDEDEFILWEDKRDGMQTVRVADIITSQPMIAVYANGPTLSDENQYANDLIRVLIPLIANTELKGHIRSSSLRNPFRSELEILHYGREKLVHDFVLQKRGTVWSIPRITFIDGLGLWGKGTAIWRSMLAFYTFMACLPNYYRKLVRNWYPLALGPMGVAVEDVMATLSKGLQQLADGVELIIKSKTGEFEKGLMVSTDLAVIGDMVQQNKNAGVKCHKADRCCRNCTCDTQQRTDLSFDIHKHGRFMMSDNEHRRALLSEPNIAVRNIGFHLAGLDQKHPVWPTMVPGFSQYNMFPHEPCHVLPNGLGHIMQKMLVEDCLKVRGANDYAAAIKRIPVPSGWGNLQNAYRHFRSMDYNQLCACAQLNPICIRFVMDPSFISTAARNKLVDEYEPLMKENHWTVTDLIAWFYAKFARVMYYTFFKETTPDSHIKLDEVVRDFIEHFLKFATVYGLMGNGKAKSKKEKARDARRKTANAPKNPEQAGDTEGEEGDQEEVNQKRQGPVDNLLNDEVNDPTPGSAAYDLSERVKVRPNLHNAIHLSGDMWCYGTCEPQNGSPGEARHEPIRRTARQTNHKNVDCQVLSRDEALSLTRHMVEGSYEDTYPQMTEAIRKLYEEAPKVFKGGLKPTDVPALKAKIGERLMKCSGVKPMRKATQKLRNIHQFPGTAKYDSEVRHLILEMWKQMKIQVPEKVREFPIVYYASMRLLWDYSDRPSKSITYNRNTVYELNFNDTFVYAKFAYYIDTFWENPGGAFAQEYSRYKFVLMYPVIRRGTTDRVLSDYPIYDCTEKLILVQVNRFSPKEVHFIPYRPYETGPDGGELNKNAYIQNPYFV